MFLYFLKVSAIWALLLLIYEIGFKKSTAFWLNRVYLLGSILLGLFIPNISLSFLHTEKIIETQVSSGIKLQQFNNAVPIEIKTVGTMQLSDIIFTIYLIGVVVLSLLTIFEVIKIIKKAIYGNYIIVSGHKIFSSNIPHPPFSFMGWIFIARPEVYSEQELNYILKHEDAHNRLYHWLDIIIMQFCFIAFWFHPLIWRYRYLLKMTHEFEADKVASMNNVRDYGHFLLEQTLLNGVPVIAHAFNFSPIKNRIFMLTQKRKTSIWKYTLVVPVLLGCTMLFAKTLSADKRIKEGNVTSYNGHKFYWKDGGIVDSMVLPSPTDGKPYTQMITSEPSIFKMDNDAVHTFTQNFKNFQYPKFRTELLDITDYFTGEFKKKIPESIDSISQIQINNVVVDASGKILYYDIAYMGRGFKDKIYSSNPILDPVVDAIIKDCPLSETVTDKGVPVPTFFGHFASVVLNNISGKARPIGKM